jgi:hypothetical protein
MNAVGQQHKQRVLLCALPTKCEMVCVTKTDLSSGGVCCCVMVVVHSAAGSVLYASYGRLLTAVSRGAAVAAMLWAVGLTVGGLGWVDKN